MLDLRDRPMGCKVGAQINQHIIKINKFALNGIFNCIITISDTLKY